MRIFITGVSGLLGINAALQLQERHEVSGVYCSHPVKVEGAELRRLDLTDQAAVLDLVSEIRPQVILHTAGLTNVDACEVDPAQAELLNVRVSEHVARAAAAAGAALVHISTDHLSDGTKALTAESVQASPLNEYARTKWEAERIVSQVCPGALIIRTNFFGWGTPAKASFSDWILEGLRSGKSLPLFVDVHVTPVLINDLVAFIERLLERRVQGVFNVAGSERVSKYEFGVQLARAFEIPAGNLRPLSVHDVPLRACRPQDMSLNCDRVSALLGQRMPTLGESLARLRALGEQGWPQALRRSWGQP